MKESPIAGLVCRRVMVRWCGKGRRPKSVHLIMRANCQSLSSPVSAMGSEKLLLLLLQQILTSLSNAVGLPLLLLDHAMMG